MKETVFVRDSYEHLHELCTSFVQIKCLLRVDQQEEEKVVSVIASLCGICAEDDELQEYAGSWGVIEHILKLLGDISTHITCVDQESYGDIDDGENTYIETREDIDDINYEEEEENGNIDGVDKQSNKSNDVESTTVEFDSHTLMRVESALQLLKNLTLCEPNQSRITKKSFATLTRFLGLGTQIQEVTSDIFANVSGWVSAPRIKTLEIGGFKVKVREISAGADTDMGFTIWKAAFALSNWICVNSELFKGKTVLELGCGCGMVGFVAAHFSPTKVVMTDYVDKVLANVKMMSLLNKNIGTVNADVDVRKLNWYELENDKSSESFDIILGSDIFYGIPHALAIPKVIDKYLSMNPDASAFIIFPDDRMCSATFKSEMSKLGFGVEKQKLFLIDTPQKFRLWRFFRK